MSASPMAPGSFDATTPPDVAADALPGARPSLALARAAAAGDAASITALYRISFDAVFAAATRASGRDEQFCLDVVQETFLRIMRSGSAAARIRDDAHAHRWILTIAQNVTLDMLRAERRRAARDRVAGRPEVADRPDARGMEERMGALVRELESLAPEDRELLVLRTSGMTLGALAEAVGATVGSVHGRLRRLMRWIASRHDAQDGDAP